MNRVVVTGGAGFIGSHAADAMVRAGHAVLILDDLSYGRRENVNPAATFAQVDLADRAACERLILDFAPTHVLHFAANATTRTTSMGWADPAADSRSNMASTLNLLEILRAGKLDAHLVYASTAAVYGEPESVPVREDHPTLPLSPYGVSKLAGEKYCHAYFKECGIRSTIFRIFNTFGPRQPRYVMYEQLRNMLVGSGDFDVLGTGEQLRDYAYVSDTVDAFALAMRQPEQAVGEVFNLAGGNVISIRDLIEDMRQMLGVTRQARFTGASWKGDISRLWGDTSRAREKLGWTPRVSLEAGLQDLIGWMRAHGHL
jgi:UDP-glucose 4-epimerase